MRKTLVVLGLAALGFLVCAEDASAQLFGRRRARRNQSNMVYSTTPNYSNGYNGPVMVDQNGNSYTQGPNGQRIYSQPGMNQGIAPAGFNSIPGTQGNQSTQPQSSYYSGPGLSPNQALVMVMVPNPDAEVFFENTATQQRGLQRIFSTPQLQQAGTYTIKARWTQNGQPVTQERQIRVQPGQEAVVDFRIPQQGGNPQPTPLSNTPKSLPQ